MKTLPIGLALLLPMAAGCGQLASQSVPAPNAGSTILSPVGASRMQPATCNAPWEGGTSFSGLYVRWPSCGGHNGRMYYGSGSTPGRKLSSTTSTSNPGGVPVPPGETPVLFDQMLISPNNPGSLTFTPPIVGPGNTNKSRITGFVPLTGTYQLYAYNGNTLQAGFPIALGSPNAGGVLFFNAAPNSPLPLLAPLAPGTTISFELVTP